MYPGFLSLGRYRSMFRCCTFTLVELFVSNRISICDSWSTSRPEVLNNVTFPRPSKRVSIAAHSVVCLEDGAHVMVASLMVVNRSSGLACNRPKGDRIGQVSHSCRRRFFCRNAVRDVVMYCGPLNAWTLSFFDEAVRVAFFLQLVSVT